MKLSNIKIWHRVLSADEMTRFYNGEDIKCGCRICANNESEKELEK